MSILELFINQIISEMKHCIDIIVKSQFNAVLFFTLVTLQATRATNTENFLDTDCHYFETNNECFIKKKILKNPFAFVALKYF